jgi:hypothetical protein
MLSLQTCLAAAAGTAVPRPGTAAPAEAVAAAAGAKARSTKTAGNISSMYNYNICTSVGRLCQRKRSVSYWKTTQEMDGCAA